ncbi:unnamed protein product [Phaedon cochleariae]|uniref:Uncharacterized protein n=1 Tax=Phaedon cochleariae TaxID=80249 RepID=A0A9P0DQ82_PHACE|nr:unnamed protein product [Phaedon cochleariae]
MHLVECCLLLFILGDPTASQSCREYSQSCNDDKACCGGCCMDGICKDTYADCRLNSDPCLEALCPPDQECYVYYPTHCPGCGPTKECRDAPRPPEIPTSTEAAKIANKSSNFTLSKSVFFISFLILYTFYR